MCHKNRNNFICCHMVSSMQLLIVKVKACVKPVCHKNRNHFICCHMVSSMQLLIVKVKPCVKLVMFLFSSVNFLAFFRKQKGFYLQKSMERKNFEAQYLKTAHAHTHTRTHTSMHITPISSYPELHAICFYESDIITLSLYLSLSLSHTHSHTRTHTFVFVKSGDIP